MTATLAGELEASGGAAAPPSAVARLRETLAGALEHGRRELAKPRSGYEAPVEVAIALDGDLLVAATPAAATLRADPKAAGEREWLLVAATVAALVELACPGPPATDADLVLLTGELEGGHLLLAQPAAGLEPAELEELAPEFFAETARRIDRLRARAVVLPPGVIELPDLKAPIGAGHPLRVAEVEARLGAELEDEQREEAVLAILNPGGDRRRPPARRPGPRPAASPGGSSSGSTAWASGAATTPTSPTSRAASRATSGRSRRTSARRSWPRACSPRSRRSASATCSSTPAARATSGR